MSIDVIGMLSDIVVQLLSLPYTAGDKILMGQSNIDHMCNSHPDAYARYGDQIPIIITSPDYVGINKSDNSIEYVKQYQSTGEYVKVAVRASASGILFARSVYILNTKRVLSFIKSGKLYKLT